MIDTLAYLNSYGIKGAVVALMIAACVIYLLFYVIPLPNPIRTILAVVVAILLILFFLPGCSIELHADGTKKVSFSPTTADYKAIKQFSR